MIGQSKHQMIIILLGPQGSGKGTQAVLLSKKFSLPVIEMSQLLKKKIKEISMKKTEMERKMTKGKLISNQITINVLKDQLKKINLKKGFILDGFPRNLVQAHFLERFKNKVVIYLDITNKEAIQRLSKRKICDSCGRIFVSKRNFVTCPWCGGKLARRADDRPEIIKKRLDLFKKFTKPVLDYYRSKNILLEINGQQKINKVFQDILKALKLKTSGLI